MRPLSDAQERNWLILRLISMAMGVVAPALYLMIATMLHPESSPIGENGAPGSVDMMFYLLLIIGACSPLVIPFIERIQISNWRGGSPKRNPDQVFFSLAIIRLAFVEATFIYGFFVYLLTWDLMRMLMFYLIGLVWLAIFWPRREKYEQFIAEFEGT